ncbi:spindle and kinetochore-associated protein 1 isoform X1 [Sebastes umbrosus]|uniref:spindle and kinetochore-associated protein 1 isoform X1 n=1 Tax=Sebastes umbrosus TaxID=72105 RepID=UPI00189E2C80|nr:spindle and kinetochore-associated protein 1 isoform X1 [Sebastes umbrosus]XP_037622116.1 spindle and kinetochore-associated protein 1 isoform X1 [Sebastes umbrosus]XP_037622118.1 spindle and kinetochore-associated protein 1 isoform X1 [Sebastes umbrosus]
MSELEDISRHVHDKISSIQCMLDLSAVELPQRKKLGQELFALEGLLEEFEKCVGQQEEQLKHLKELEESSRKDLEDLQHFKDNIPAHMPRKKGPARLSRSKNPDAVVAIGVEPCGSEPVMNQTEAADVQPVQQEAVKKTNKSFVREIMVITIPEFESIPQYMKGRASYHQLNAAVQSINTAVSAKYKILHQPVKTLKTHARKLHKRFKDQETKDTKGHFFVVEDDIREFTQMKADKRFQGILNMLRHCHRLRELRGGGITRYMLL